MKKYWGIDKRSENVNFLQGRAGKNQTTPK